MLHKQVSYGTNPLKNKLMVLCTSQRQARLSTSVSQLSINNFDIECVSHFNTLGLIIDQNLSWKCHVSALCKTLVSSISAFIFINYKESFYRQ